MGQQHFRLPLTVFVVFFCLVVSVGLCPGKDLKPAAGHQQKGSGDKIIVEYVSFPATLKQYEVYPWEILKVPQFRKACAGVLGGSSRDEWVRSLTGTGNPGKMIRARKEGYVLVTSCKPHSCDTSQVLVLFSPLSGKCWGLYANDGKFQELGNPDDAVRNLLKVLLVEEYKEIYKAQ